MNDELKANLIDYMFELLADYYAPLTDDLLVEAMEDLEMVQTAYDFMIENIENYFIKHYDVERINK